MDTTPTTDQTIQPLDCKTASIDELKHAINNRLPVAGITGLLTHKKMHWEEFLGHFLIKCTDFGKKMFPGIENAIMDFKTRQEFEKYELTGIEGWYEALQMGFLITGTADGIFDEHTVRSDKNPSSARMIAEYLGITKDPVYRKVFQELLNYTDYEDRNGDRIDAMFDDPMQDTQLKLAAQSLLPGSYIKMRWNDIDENDAEGHTRLIKWVFEMIHGYVESRTIFHVNAKQAYLGAKKEVVPTLMKDEGGKKMVLLIMETDNHLAIRYASTAFSGKADQKLAARLVINSKNQFSIFPGKGNKDLMPEIAKIIQTTILRNMGIKHTEWKELGNEGSHPEIPEIHFQKSSGIIMNGSLRETDVPGLVGKRIKKEQLIWNISVGLSNEFHSEFKAGCVKGICAKGECPFYAFGLNRCHAVRKQTPTGTNGRESRSNNGQHNGSNYRSAERSRPS